MPKVISRSAVSSSTDAQPTPSSAAALRVYYCICGEFVLVIDKSLAALPRRKTDNAVVIRAQDSEVSKARIFKLNVIIDDPVFLERKDQGATKNNIDSCVHDVRSLLDTKPRLLLDKFPRMPLTWPAMNELEKLRQWMAGQEEQ